MRRGIRLKHIKRITSKGRAYVYFARPGFDRIRLPDLPENHPDFLAAYAAAAREAGKVPSTAAPKAGTVAALVVAYKQSQAWQRLKPGTRTARSHVLARIAAKGGQASAAGLRERHILNDMAGLSPNPFNMRLKTWRGLMDFAKRAGLVTLNPVEGIKQEAAKTAGHHTWTPEEITKFREAHAHGSDARLAFELAYFTGARRSDLVRLGHQMIDGGGWLTFRQDKTGGEVEIPVLATLTGPAADLAEDHGHLLAAMRASGVMDAPGGNAPPEHMLFITTRTGTGRSTKAFGAWFKKACTAAGLPVRCTLHGLRKRRASDLAELGWGETQIGAWTGHRTLTEIVHYTAKANRRRMIGGTEQERNTVKPVVQFSKSGEKSSRNKDG